MPTQRAREYAAGVERQVAGIINPFERDRARDDYLQDVHLKNLPTAEERQQAIALIEERSEREHAERAGHVGRQLKSPRAAIWGCMQSP